jgi:hypothetical protein
MKVFCSLGSMLVKTGMDMPPPVLIPWLCPMEGNYKKICTKIVIKTLLQDKNIEPGFL